MSRVKRGVTAHRRHKKILKMAKGYRGLRHKIFKQAKNAVMKAGMHAYRHRRTKKREFRRLWIVRINAAVRAQGMTYSAFINALLKANVQIDRKMMSELATNNEKAFAKIVETAKSQA